MDSLDKVKDDIEQMMGLAGSDADAFWALSKKCGALAVAPAIAAGVTWGSGFVSMGTVTLPGLGTVSGATAALLLMGGVWGSNYGACMALLPGLLRLRDSLRNDPFALNSTRQEVRRLVALHRTTPRA